MKTPTLPDPASTFELDVEEVAALGDAIDRGELNLIDCRESDEWELARIPGSRLVPLSRFVAEAEAMLAEPVPTVVYCHHGMRSLKAVSWLRARGLERCWSMRGGIEAWSDRIDGSIPSY